MIYGVPLAGANGEVKRNGRVYGNHCKLEIYTGNWFGYRKIVVREWRYYMFNEEYWSCINNKFFFAYNCYVFFLLIFLLTIPYFFYIRFYIYAITCEILSINLFLLINRLISVLLHFLFKLHSLFWNQLECM